MLRSITPSKFSPLLFVFAIAITSLTGCVTMKQFEELQASCEEIDKENSQTVISTAFETGIGRRWINHLAARQVKGKNPCAPGLAPGWCPKGPLFDNNPKLVWEAA